LRYNRNNFDQNAIKILFIEFFNDVIFFYFLSLGQRITYR